MSVLIQWSIVIAAIVIAAVYLTRRMKRSTAGKCDGCCKPCSGEQKNQSCDD